ncbi:hypothetical protein AKJ16_DCAP12315 [Drosera capensis]
MKSPKLPRHRSRNSRFATAPAPPRTNHGFEDAIVLQWWRARRVRVDHQGWVFITQFRLRLFINMPLMIDYLANA